MNQELVPQNRQIQANQQQSLFSMGPQAMVRHATEIANVLSDVIKKQRLAVRIGPNEYVKSEGWATLGVMLGILPRESRVTESENGDFEAYVDLVRQTDGVVVGGASSLCATSEKRWKDADRYARRSMAITRATGKAYRLSFAWIMTLAGYNPTPYEEMPHDVTPVPPAAQARKGQKKAEGFDPNIKAHADWIEKELKSRGVDESLWDDVALTLTGRPSDAFDDVLKTVTGAL